MGEYSSICAVTGIPITDHQQIVGFEVEPSRFNDRNQYVPLSWPVFGEYDMYGGIEGCDFTQNVALVHRAVWDNAEKYWHTDNRKTGPHFLNVDFAVEKAKQQQKLYGELRLNRHDNHIWTDTDYLFYALREQFTETDEGIGFRELIQAKVDALPHPDGLCFLERSRFSEIMLRKMIDGIWTAENMETVHKLVCLFCGEMLTGKIIGPSTRPFVEQYPDYTQRKRLARFHLNLMIQLSKEQK